MIKLFQVAAFFTSLLVLQPRSYAIDVAGSQLTYRHLAGPDYRITFVHYRDCFGPQSAPLYIYLEVSSASCGIAFVSTMDPIAGTGSEFSNACSSVVSTCNAGIYTGVQKWVYESVVTLPGQCPDWVFSAKTCCFNVTTTFSNIHNHGTYAEARLNNLISDNSSPQFTNDPVITICQNQDFHYNNGMVDEEGDSLAYTLTPVLADTGIAYPNIPGYSPSQPVTSIPPVTFDQVSGDLFMHPPASEIGLIAYTVQDFRNGDFMGSVTRTIAIHTITCNNATPVLTGINGSSQYSLYVFPGAPFCFDIYSNDADAGQSLTLSWNNGINGAVFTPAGAPHPTGTFCWTPSMNDLRPQPYMFTATIKDNNCPYRGIGVYSYLIYVTLDSSLVMQPGDGPESRTFFSVIPNPSNGIVTIQSTEKFSQLKIYNLLGECVLKKGNANEFDLSGLPSGIYFLEAMMGNATMAIRKLVLQR